MKHTTRWLPVLLLISLLMPARLASAGNTSPQPGITYQMSGDGISLSLTIRDFQWQQQAGGLVLVVNGAEFNELPGQPQVPVFSALVALPPTGEFQVMPETGRSSRITPPGYMVLTAEPEVQTDRFFSDPFPAVAACEGVYPENAVEVGEPAWLRNQRVVRVSFTPYQWDCQRQQWIQTENLTVRLALEEATNDSEITNIELDAFEDIYRSSLINYQDGRDWRGQPGDSLEVKDVLPAADLYALIPGVSYLRLTIPQAGVYRVSYEDMAAAGMDPNGFDPWAFLLQNQGHTAAYMLEDDGDRLFEPGEALLFFGEEFDGSYLASLNPQQDDHWLTYNNGFTPQFNREMIEKYSDDNVYWLSVSATPSARIEGINTVPADPETIKDFRSTVTIEKDFKWWTIHFTSEETWFWENNIGVASNDVERSFNITLSDVLIDGNYIANITGELTSSTAVNVINPDHRIAAFMNNQLLVEDAWDGAVWHKFSGSISQSLLINGENTLRVRFKTIPGVITSRYGFDQFSVTYQRSLVALENELQFSHPDAGDWAFDVNGFSDANVRIWQINNPLSPLQFTESSLLEGSLHFANQQTEPTTYITFGDSAVRTPGIAFTVPQDLYDANNRADYLIITRPEFTAALQPLIAWREQQGLTVKVVDLQTIYDLFNFGIPHPIAVKNFFTFAYYLWSPPAPAYVLVVGDGHWDLKNYLIDDPQYFPPNFLWVDPVQGEIDSLSDLVMVAGNDILPDAMIGRMAVNSAQELTAIIDKTIAFETSRGSWQQSLAFAADNYYISPVENCTDGDPSTVCTVDSAGNFPAVMDQFITDVVPETFQVTRFYQDDYGCRSGTTTACDLLTSDLVGMINAESAQIYTYSGHGAIPGWSNELIFNSSDIPSLTNESRFPIFFSLDCVDGFWYYPPGVSSGDTRSLAEELSRAANKGAAATYSAIGLGYTSGHDILQRGFFDNFFNGSQPTIGTADLSAKLNAYNSLSNDELVYTFMVFGDPALRLFNARPAVFLPFLTR
jgi:hypothetical protein